MLEETNFGVGYDSLGRNFVVKDGTIHLLRHFVPDEIIITATGSLKNESSPADFQTDVCGKTIEEVRAELDSFADYYRGVVTIQFKLLSNMADKLDFIFAAPHDSLTSHKEIKEFMDSDLFVSFVKLNLADKS